MFCAVCTRKLDSRKMLDGTGIEKVSLTQYVRRGGHKKVQFTKNVGGGCYKKAPLSQNVRRG